MATLVRARHYLVRHPSQALADTFGLVAACGLIFAAFMLPALN